MSNFRQTLTVRVAVDGTNTFRSQISSIVGALRGFHSTVGGITASMRALSRIALLATVFHVIRDAYRNTIGLGINFNATLEDTRLGIAAVQRQLQPGLFPNLESAMVMADGMLSELKARALESKMSFTELAQGLQQITGAATEGGIALKDQISLALTMSQVLPAIGLPKDQFLQETRALLMGLEDRHAMTMRILNISKEEVFQAREQNQLYSLLMTKLSAFREAAVYAQNNLTTLWARVFETLEMAAGEALEPLFELSKDLARSIMSIDWKGMAQQIASFLDVAIGAWKDGTFGQFLSLTIEAAFEKGFETAGQLGAEFLNWMRSEGTSVIRHVVVSIITGLLKGGVTALTTLITFQATILWRALEEASLSTLKAFTWGVNKLVDMVNNYIAAINAVFGTDWSGIGKIDPESSANALRGMFAQGQLGLLELDKDVKETIKGWIDTAADFWRGNEPLGLRGDNAARRQLEALMFQARLRRAASRTTGAIPDGSGPPKVVELDKERALQDELLRLGRDRAIMEGDFSLTEAQKFRERREFLRSELAIRQDILEVLRAKADAEKTADSEERAARAAKEFADAQAELEKLGPNPNSLREQFMAGWTGMLDSWGTIQQQLSGAFFGTIEKGIQGISSGLAEAIVLTGDFGKALSNIRTMILLEIVTAMVQMGVRWVTTHVLMAGVSKAWSALTSALRAKDVMESNAAEAAKAPLIQSNALGASIGSWGVAAAVGLAAVLAAVAAFGGFRRNGGPVSRNTAYIVGEDGPELFTPSSNGRISTAGETESMLSGSGSRTSQDGASPVVVNNHIYTSFEAAMDGYLKSPAGQRRLLSVVGSRAVEIGLPR